MISVVIPARDAGEHLKRCLHALTHQERPGLFEIIVVASEGDAALAVNGARVRVVRFPRPLTPGAARNIGVREAWGKRVAFLDVRCEAPVDWLARLRRQSSAPVGGCRELARANSLGAWVQYLLEFNEFLPSSPRREARFVPAGNFCLPRAVALAHPFDEEAVAAEDVALGSRLPCRFEPTLRVRYHARSGFSETLRHLYARGAASAHTRIRLGLPGAGLVDYPWLAWGLLPYRFISIGMRLLSSRRRVACMYGLLAPWMAAGLAAWTAGAYRTFAGARLAPRA